MLRRNRGGGSVPERRWPGETGDSGADGCQGPVGSTATRRAGGERTWLRRIYAQRFDANSAFTQVGQRLRASECMRNAQMPGWLSMLCGIVVIVAAVYLLLVILRPEKF